MRGGLRGNDFRICGGKEERENENESASEERVVVPSIAPEILCTPP